MPREYPDPANRELSIPAQVEARGRIRETLLGLPGNAPESETFLTDRELAARIGGSPRPQPITVAQWRRGEVNPASPQAFEAMIDALGVSGEDRGELVADSAFVRAVVARSTAHAGGARKKSAADRALAERGQGFLRAAMRAQGGVVRSWVNGPVPEQMLNVPPVRVTGSNDLVGSPPTRLILVNARILSRLDAASLARLAELRTADGVEVKVLHPRPGEKTPPIEYDLGASEGNPEYFFSAKSNPLGDPMGERNAGFQLFFNRSWDRARPLTETDLAEGAGTPAGASGPASGQRSSPDGAAPAL